ncbi:DEAD/DEAH box helicase [Fusobacterium necrophorum]|uniref:DEAD/DEAH box helicase n=1 Tax=Fusobacterium necrophorum BL TaxID=1441732 RepID=A0AB73BY27_9FUSO|nr:DEAD/DEAH box helicase [Fusobacterium necrophorum]AYZ73427.1 DEAD/DEAH box helicase [Fusobacterium necrophorum]AZW08576.1 DEAD/DEAH box helicase [Fusobacterium necrophorum subsp. necrophorum]KDE63786.1 DEAD/DEAH box helicase [Fusobacterium necrophorum BL]SDB41248.1 SNF2 family N-terminal domain-containing protein [Fusobacterium necrophorum]SQD09500.1 DNA methylase [Fusobacterium necrophorum subsp. necrophorum]
MKFVPHNYQKYCIERMVDDNILGLMLDMGLGKTIITLTAIQELKYNRFEVNKVLIIAPKKVAEVTWTDEIEKWEHLHLLRPSLVLGSASKRIKALAKNADVYVINRENVVWLVEYYKNNWPFDMVVLDEWSSFKNHQSKRFKYLKMVRGKMKRVVGLTGTPTPNGLIDLWAQVYLLDQGARLEKTIGRYRERYFDPGQRNRTTIFNYEAKDGSEHAIHEKIADICISMKAEDYLQLPDVIYETVPVVLDSKAKKSYEELEKKMILELEAGEEITVASAAALSNKLQQLANGAIYGENREVFEIHDCKIERFLELIEQLNGKPALVFYNFQHDLSRIQEALTKSGLRVRLLKSPEDQKDWNEHKIDILLAHPASAAYGLNLQEGGNHVVWFGLNWSLELYQQANKRLHRQGQKEKVIIHHLITKGTRDEDVMVALENKGNVQEELLQSLKVRIEKVKRGG